MSLNDMWTALGKLVGYEADSPMLFNSGSFLFLFTLFLFGYGAIYRQKTLRTLYVLIFSLFFYYKSSGSYLVILLFSIVLDYGVAFLIHGAKTQAIRKFWLILSVTANVGLLMYFKYTNFFLENIGFLTGKPFDPLDLFLPIGISFYTFQTLSYVIDVYRGLITPTRSLLDYAFYMSFFPHLVAGPIVRAREFLPQVRQDIEWDRHDLGVGFYLILKGLIKKAVFANYIAQYNDLIFENPAGYSGFENLMAMYGYALQIYCDFSGYSDMAIGIAKLMGFQLGDNFNTPYISKNITEFWRRWHISLSSWLRDYLYIPLGGNRKGKFRTYLHLFLTMLIGGFWHGASWKFVLWGGVHGMGLAVHKLWSQYAPESRKNSGLWRVFSLLLTFHFVAFLWLFFRADSFSVAWTVIESIFTRMDWAYVAPFLNVRGLFVALLLLGYGLQYLPLRWKEASQTLAGKTPFLAKTAILLIVIQLMLQIQTEDVQPFIYFQF